MKIRRISLSFVRVFAALWASIAILVTPASAMRVSPMVVEMETRGGNAVARIEVQNINAGKLAFETRVYRMDMDADGNLTETPADDQFLIFPPQGALPASGRQVVRLQWVGDPEMATSQAYYVSVEQLPIAFDPGSEEEVAAQVQVLYNMRALVVVAPPGAKPDVTAQNVRSAVFQPKAAPGAEATPPAIQGVTVTLRNDGRRHAMMSNFGWKLEGKDPNGGFLRVDISPEELTAAVGTGFVAAQSQRTFNLPIGGFGSEPIKLTFQR